MSSLQETPNGILIRQTAFKRQRPPEENLKTLYNSFFIDQNEDEVVSEHLKEYSLVFTRSCFSCLHRSDLSPKVITGYVAMLQQRDIRNHIPGKKFCVFLSSWFFPDLYAMKFDLARLQFPKFVHDKLMVFMPIELGDKSWILCTVDIQNKKLAIYHPELSVYNKDLVYNIVLNWLQYESRGDPRLPNKPFVPFNKAEWQRDTNVLTRQTVACDDSGVFVLLCIEFLSVGLAVPTCDTLFLKAFRERIGVSLLTGEIEEAPGVMEALNLLALRR